MDTATALVKPKHNRPPSATQLLEELRDAFPNEKVTVAELIDKLENRAIGLLLLILALPMCIPNVPGISTIFGLLLLAPAVQMIFGGKKLWLPQRVRNWSFSRHGMQSAIKGAAPYLRRIEKYVRPRWSVLTRAPFTILFGVVVLVMAIVLTLPIPFGNWPPAMTLAIIALALLQRDGLLMLLSLPAAAASIAIAYAGVRIGFAALVELGSILHSWLTALTG
ncbi:MAG: exopolysaccharide biosynthesis protein [Caulobacterales bacterium]